MLDEYKDNIVELSNLMKIRGLSIYESSPILSIKMTSIKQPLHRINKKGLRVL